MTPDRWRQIEELYHSARERGVGVLADTDPELRREVERLLAQDSDGRILDQPAVELLEEFTATERAPGGPVLGAGACLGHYKIDAPIGAGGMGEVFRATDNPLAPHRGHQNPSTRQGGGPRAQA